MIAQRDDLDATDDEALMVAHAAGDHRAFSVLYDRHLPGAVRYAWRMLRRREEAEEICAEIFARLHAEGWPGGTLRGYLFTLVHHRCVDRLRQRERSDRLAAWIPWGRSPQETPEAHALLSEQQQSLERAIAALPQAHRSAVLLYYGQELPSKQVAEILGCTDQEVRSRLSYARRRLRDLMREAL